MQLNDDRKFQKNDVYSDLENGVVNRDILLNVDDKFAHFLYQYQDNPIVSLFLDRLDDAIIAAYYKKRMDEVGSHLVKTLGPGAGADIDNYYHTLLQYVLAQRGPSSKKFGIAMGYGKEVYDTLKKGYRALSDYTHGVFSGNNILKENDKLLNRIQENWKDTLKDLNNNERGSLLGTLNPSVPGYETLDFMRTPNMRMLNIR